MHTDPKCTKIQSNHQCLLALLGLVSIKAVRKMLVKSTPEVKNDVGQVTHASEIVGRACEEELLDEVVGLGALGDPGLNVISLDPVGQPLQVAVAVERIGADCLE